VIPFDFYFSKFFGKVSAVVKALNSDYIARLFLVLSFQFLIREGVFKPSEFWSSFSSSLQYTYVSSAILSSYTEYLDEFIFYTVSGIFMAYML